MAANTNIVYRDQLVEMIKAAGQELIDRAETMVAKDLELIGDLDIWIRIPNPRDNIPTIEWSIETPIKKVYSLLGDSRK